MNLKKSLITVALVAMLACPAFAQVSPRLITVWAGTLTNFQTVTVYSTNLLSASTWHNVGLWESLGSTNAGVFNSNVIVSMYPLPSPTWYGGLTGNLPLGTNAYCPTTPNFNWTNAWNGVTNVCAFTSVAQAQADSVYGWKVVIANQSTNSPGGLFQLDIGLTP